MSIQASLLWKIFIIFIGKPRENNVNNLIEFHCSYLFIEFDKFWLECQPKDIMEFNRIRDLFENNIRSQLQEAGTCFKVNIQIDTV